MMNIETDSEWNPYAIHEQEIESLRQQLADKDAEIERLDDEIGYQSQWKTEFRQQKEYAEKQLAASQAREVMLREAFGWALDWIDAVPKDTQLQAMPGFDRDYANGLVAMPQDTTDLSAMIAKAGEVMRERCAAHLSYFGEVSQRRGDEIRALPGVTLEDLKD